MRGVVKPLTPHAQTRHRDGAASIGRGKGTPEGKVGAGMPQERIRHSSGNVFQDLGFAGEEAENLRVRADLMIALSELIEERGLTQAQAAQLLGVSQPRVSDLVRGKIDRFSVDTFSGCS
jgi:predicted XRE-type DNA-binding protein